MIKPIKYNRMTAHANRDLIKTAEIRFNDDGGGDCEITLRERSQIITTLHRDTIESAREVVRDWLEGVAFQ
jgi:hypothetical protein